MARMVRLLRAMPELMILVKGMAVATRSVFFTLCLLLIMIYVFGIAFTQLARDTPLQELYFPSVPDSMSTLLLRGTLPDLHEFVTTIGDESGFFAVVALFFILLTSLTVLNMLVGVLCEVVSVVSAVEKEQMTVQFVKSKLLALIANSGIDRDGNKCVSKSEFETLLLMPEGARIIEEVGVDVVGLVDFADDIFKDGIELSFPDFMELVLQLRSNNVATVRDIVDLRKLVGNLFQDLSPAIQNVCEVVVSTVDGKLKEVQATVKQIQAMQDRTIQAVQNQPQQPQAVHVPDAQPQVGNGPSNRSASPPRSAGRGRPNSGQIRPPSKPGRARPDSGQTRPNSGNARAMTMPGQILEAPGSRRGQKPPGMPLPANTWLTQYEDEGST